MPLFYRFLFIFAALCCSAQLLAEPVAWGGRWQTLSSDHFVVNFQQQHSQQALRALTIAEQVHSELLGFFLRAPQAKTQLVIVDDYDLSNGWATPLPFNQIRLFLHAATPENGLEQLDDWWHGLIRHEYVHILHMDMGSGVTEVGRRWFGRLPFFFPHVFTPAVFSEGLAVYLESDQEQGIGRLVSSHYAMQMRAELLGHGGDDLNQVVVAQRDWPVGKQYLYGAYFWQFIAETYSQKHIVRYLHYYSRQLLPYVMQNYVAKQVFGKSFQQLWDEYLQWLEENYLPANKPEYNLGIVLEQPLNNLQITATSEAGLWQVRVNGEDRPALQLWSVAGTQPELKTYVKRPLSIDVAETGEVVVSRLVPNKTGQAFADLFIWQTKVGWQRLTNKQRFTRARWLNVQQILASRQIAGKSELWLLDRAGKQQLLWRGDKEVLADFTVHPQQQFIVGSLKRAGQGWNLEQFDLIKLQWQSLINSKAVEQHPEFLSDGSLLFSADYDGMFNIYRLLNDQQTLEQLTDVNTGAVHPQSVAGQLYYQYYTDSGYQLRQADLSPVRQLTVQANEGYYNYLEINELPVVGDPKPYTPWATLRPFFWMPQITSDEDSYFFGLQTSGSDALGRHSYQLDIGYNPEFELTQGTGSYLYDNRWQFLFVRDHRFYDVNVDDSLVLSRDRWLLARHHLWDAFEDQLQLHAGMTYENHHLAYQSAELDVRLQARREVLSGLAITFNNQQSFRNVMGVGHGSYGRLVYENYALFSKRISGYRLQGSWQHVFDLPGRSAIIFDGLAGYSNQMTAPYLLGGSGSKDNDLLFGRSEFGLAGYSSASLAGNHFYTAQLSYRQWLARIERNWGLWPLGLGDISGQLWSKLGNAWQDERSSPLAAIGAQLDIELILGYQLPVPVSFGVARGLDKQKGTTQAYLELGLVF